ncbi:hypothetical protein GCM10009108_04520 [Castellaniella ginsengisoli]|uniref:Uncharacterized protein n=1 Tax=Castellaniella ginsengisoli TaxID=546114 RepID=A0ABN1KR28_9BURK
MTTQQLLTPHQSQYFAWLLTRRAAGDSVESLAPTLVDSQVDLNPHQVEAALFACRKTALLRDVNERNLGHFEQEVQKLDAWADALKLGLEQDIKEIDREIKEVRRTAATSPTLEEKLSWQKKQRELEDKRSKLRRELFARQDEVEAQRNDLISQLEVQHQQQVEERTLFTVEWELV